VVAGAERAQVATVVGLGELRVVAAELGELRIELGPGRVDRGGSGCWNTELASISGALRV
jgi:hypothetical protein